MADIFTFVPSRSFTTQVKPKVTSTQFGDGYSQHIGYGINNINKSWDLSFINMPIATASSIVSFFEAKGGYEYFLFTPPGDTTQYKVICQEWSEEYTSHISRTINATFIRVFNLN